MRRIGTIISLAVLVGLALPVSADADVLFDFNGLVHGQIVDTEFQPFATWAATNPAGGVDWAMAFDTELGGINGDYDLFRDPVDSQDNRDAWKGGNLNVNTNMGKALAISDNNATNNGNSNVVDSPNDEGSQPGGVIRADFAADIFSVGFDIIDAEEYRTSWIKAWDGATFLGEVNYLDFIARDGATFGDATINRVAPLLASDFNQAATKMNRLEWWYGGSGAIDNVLVGTPVPEPGTLSLLGLGLAAGVARLRRRRK